MNEEARKAMKTILIIWSFTYNGGVAAHTVYFDSMQACLSAKEVVENSRMRESHLHVKGICIEASTGKKYHGQ